MFKQRGQLRLGGLVSFLFIAALNTTFVGCKEKPGPTGVSGANGAAGATGTYGTFPIQIIPVRVSTTTLVSGPFCSFFITQPGATAQSATCYYTLQSVSATANTLGCGTTRTYSSQPINSTIEPIGTLTSGCLANQKSVCTIVCWNAEGAGESIVNFFIS